MFAARARQVWNEIKADQLAGLVDSIPANAENDHLESWLNARIAWRDAQFEL